ncbi:hypothetical protein JHK85_028337 [Glycine max]|nr:hypothetical protein JHK85_028337 [Glycine max]
MNKPMCIQKLLISLFPSSVFTFSSSKAPLCIFSKLTSSSLERFVWHNCDLINMSYVEATLLSDYGRFVDLVNEEVNKHRLIFVSSVGNSGPRLSTIGAPGGTSSSIIGVGAYVSPAMVVGAHCVVEPPSDELEYTWYIHFSQNFLIDKFVVHC